MNRKNLFSTLFIVGVLSLMTAGAIHAQKKKGGEPCQKNEECETNACNGGRCDPCPNPENCPPPGLCGQSWHRSLQDDVDYHCKVPRTCDGNIARLDNEKVDCQELEKLLEQNRKCMLARNKINEACFKGGDKVHRDKLRDETNAYQTCQDLLAYKKSRGLCK